MWTSRGKGETIPSPIIWETQIPFQCFISILDRGFTLYLTFPQAAIHFRVHNTSLLSFTVL